MAGDETSRNQATPTCLSKPTDLPIGLSFPRKRESSFADDPGFPLSRESEDWTFFEKCSGMDAAASS
jgi:hypothetical protein